MVRSGTRSGHGDSLFDEILFGAHLLLWDVVLRVDRLVVRLKLRGNRVLSVCARRLASGVGISTSGPVGCVSPNTPRGTEMVRTCFR